MLAIVPTNTNKGDFGMNIEALHLPLFKAANNRSSICMCFWLRCCHPCQCPYIAEGRGEGDLAQDPVYEELAKWANCQSMGNHKMP